MQRVGHGLGVCCEIAVHVDAVAGDRDDAFKGKQRVKRRKDHEDQVA